MNANERRACDGLLPDEETPIERLQWELERTSRELIEMTAKMRAGGSKP